MGGNAIKDSVRFDNTVKKMIERKINHFMTIFSEHLNHYSHVPAYRYVRSYVNKQTHGDIDVVVLADVLFENPKWFEALQSDLITILSVSPDNIKKNSNVVSFGLPLRGNIYQVDLIFHRSDVYEIATYYYDWNDLGNLIGRIAHSIGFRFGHEGLAYIHRDENTIYGKTTLSKDIGEILDFLGFSDPLKVISGFDELEDIFEFVASSKYFNPDIYLLHNRNSISRRRDAKRHTYQQFLKWCENIPEREYYVRNPDKTFYLPLAFRKFPGFEQEFQRIETEYNTTKKMLDERREYYNGKLMMEWTGLTGKELGGFMKFFEGQHCFEILAGSEYEKHARHLFQYWKKAQQAETA